MIYTATYNGGFFAPATIGESCVCCAWFSHGTVITTCPPLATFVDLRRFIAIGQIIQNPKQAVNYMPGKPKWYRTTDMAGMLVGEHVEGLVFKK